MKKRSEFDVIIAGGGPAGLSALLWCTDLGLSAILLEKEAELGGQLLWTYNAIQNYLGVQAADGRELRDKFLRQIESSHIERHTNAEIVEADLVNKTVKLADGRSYSSQAILIATGVRRRKLNVPGENEFYGRGILDSGMKSRELVCGTTVVVVGGGDAALENALILSETANKIFIIHRRHRLGSRMKFIESVQKSDKIEFVFDSQVTKILGDKRVNGVELQHLTSGNRSRIDAEFVLTRIGVEPNTELFGGQIEVDVSGYIKVDSNCVASIPGIFAIGDIASPRTPTIAAAVGNGATAAKAATLKINDSKTLF